MERTAMEILRRYGQTHVTEKLHLVDKAKRESLFRFVSRIDFNGIQSALADNAQPKAADVINPINVLSLQEIAQKKSEYCKLGIRSLRNGEVGAVILAGGQGTRLGSDKPKGMFDVGVTKYMQIFQIHAENILKTARECGAPLHLFIMTNENSYEEIIAFFHEHGNFGYDAEYLHFYRQGMNPAFDKNGKLLLKSPGEIALSPSGNGDWYASLMASECGEVVNDAGICYMNVVSIDNVLQRIYDPIFIGAMVASGCACGAKVVKKRSAGERVGVICKRNGMPSVVEYYELSDEMRAETDESGNPLYDYGVILNYLFTVKKLNSILHEPLPIHIAEKKVPFMDASGTYIEPDTPNAYKFETLILDMISLMETCLPFEVEREEEFAPIKNRTGEDSLITAREMLARKIGVL
jgi:UDP-N-acetylglucosamine/UDP-N-acetylgalactosamine diphosphorylase